jgi:hypothetical protein
MTPSYRPLRLSPPMPSDTNGPRPLLLSESVYGLSEYLERRFQLRYVENAAPLAERTVTVSCDDIDTIGNVFGPGYVTYRSGRTTVIESDTVLVTAESIDRTVEIRVLGDPDAVDTAIATLSSAFVPVPVRVKWMYKANGDSVKLPIRSDNLPRSEFYPQLGDESLTDYYDRFMGSGSNVLVLIGPPGTGKTSFIRGLLHHTGSGAIVSYDTSILESDEIFADFMSGKETFMVLEDADSFLSSRSKNGNTIMHRFLNIGDGLISTSGKKIVFSTNLPSVRDIDPALLRPGRCFDVMKFGKLSADVARSIRPDYTSTDPVSLAELLGEGGDAGHAHTSVGFV